MSKPAKPLIETKSRGLIRGFIYIFFQKEYKNALIRYNMNSLGAGLVVIILFLLIGLCDVLLFQPILSYFK